MLKLPKSLTVQYHGMNVGILSMSPDNSRCMFEYDKGWIANGFSISPLELPLKTGLQAARTNNFYGDFGIFEDSMPDGYGNYLLDRILRKYGTSLSEMTPVERLSFVGTKGMGALCYIPEMELNSRKDAAMLDEMQQDALDVLSEKDYAKVETLYANSGNSGGCRPKCLWDDGEGKWLVKFRHVYDSPDAGKKEYDVLRLAERCGISIPEMKLFNGKYLGTKRFDVSPDGTRLHVATASGLLCESIYRPMMDYRKLIRFTRHLTRDVSEAQQMFRRMIFNFEIGNNDDHAKNFSFVCANGKWSCSPAYDVTECPEANNGFHASLVNGKEKPGTEDYVAAAADAGLTKRQAIEAIQEIKAIVSERKDAGERAGESEARLPLRKGRGY
ncbi:MAG: type II toxin-antitoxin system HipA family toxin [Bacteroidales bacterium]|nr:type II toxin-antitoxin system HipA family toxin [Bacteroidales bacterium]